MAITTTDLRTVASNANTTTGWTGSNGVSLVTEEPTPVFGTGCLGTVVSNATQDAYFTMGAPVDMSTGMLVYVWVFLRGEMDTTANGGAQILLGDGTNRVGFHLAGSDQAAFRHDQGPVGWQCMVLDTANLPAQHTVRAGSLANLNLSAITQLGAVFKTLVKSVGGTVNCFVDIIRYGNGGVRVTGGTVGDPADLEQLAAQDRSNTNAYGVVRRLGAGSFGCQAPLVFGGASTYFRQRNAALSFEDRGLALERYSITVEGTGTTFFLGDKVGEGDGASGGSGMNITVPQGVGASFTASNDDLRIYGSTLSGFTAGVQIDSGEFIGSSVAASGQVASGSTLLRGASITGSTEAGGAYLWSAATDLRNSSFSNNGVGILHLEAGTFSYIDLGFSDNTFDLRNDSGGHVTINLTGGSPPTVDNVGASTTEVQNVVTFRLTGLVDNTEVRIYRMSDDVELFGVENTLGGEVAYEYNATEPTPVYIHIHNILYVFIRLELTLGANDATVPVQQRFDRNYSNPD